MLTKLKILTILFFLPASVLAAPLKGKISNQLGMIGVRVSSFSHGISKVYKNSPAEMYGLKVGDIILSANNVNGISSVDGEPYTYVLLKIKRGNDIKEVRVFRLAKDEISFK